MSLITRNNYEVYLLDYVEENLSPEVIVELMLFLEKNPDLKEELTSFEIHQLIPDTINLEDKKKLKRKEKVINLVNCEEVIIAEIEGENTTEMSAALHLFLKSNPTKQVDFEAYQKTKLVAVSVVFNNKKSLRKKEGKVIPLYWWYSSAAAVVIILLLLNGFGGSDQQNVLPIADKKEIILPQDDKKYTVIPNETILKEKEIVAIEGEKIIQSTKLKKEFKKNTSKIILEHKKENSILLGDLVKEKNKTIKDTLLIEQFKLNKEILVEEDIYVNVKIVYEDEEVKGDTTLINPKKIITRLDVASVLVKEQVRGNLEKGKEKLLLALNAKPFNFFKKKNKN